MSDGSSARSQTCSPRRIGRSGAGDMSAHGSGPAGSLPAVAPAIAHGYRASTVTASLAARFSPFPEGWWGYPSAPPDPVSVVQVVGSGSIDPRLIGTLW